MSIVGWEEILIVWALVLMNAANMYSVDNRYFIANMFFTLLGVGYLAGAILGRYTASKRGKK